MTESTDEVNLGHKGRGQVHLRLPAYLAETEKAAREEPRESLMHFYREQAERLRRFDVARRHAGDRGPRRAAQDPGKPDL